MESRKMVLMNVFTGQNRDAEVENKQVGMAGGVG